MSNILLFYRPARRPLPAGLAHLHRRRMPSGRSLPESHPPCPAGSAPGAIFEGRGRRAAQEPRGGLTEEGHPARSRHRCAPHGDGPVHFASIPLNGFVRRQIQTTVNGWRAHPPRHFRWLYGNWLSSSTGPEIWVASVSSQARTGHCEAFEDISKYSGAVLWVTRRRWKAGLRSWTMPGIIMTAGARLGWARR